MTLWGSASRSGGTAPRSSSRTAVSSLDTGHLLGDEHRAAAQRGQPLGALALDCADAAAEQLGGLGLGEVVEVPQPLDGPLSAWKGRQRLEQVMPDGSRRLGMPVRGVAWLGQSCRWSFSVPAPAPPRDV